MAKEIELKDAVENMGAQMLKEVASKTADAAGDGTTTATVLAQAIVTAGLKNVAAGANPMDLKRGIDKAVTLVVADLKKMSQAVGDDNAKTTASTAPTRRHHRHPDRRGHGQGEEGRCDHRGRSERHRHHGGESHGTSPLLGPTRKGGGPGSAYIRSTTRAQREPPEKSAQTGKPCDISKRAEHATRGTTAAPERAAGAPFGTPQGHAGDTPPHRGTSGGQTGERGPHHARPAETTTRTTRPSERPKKRTRGRGTDRRRRDHHQRLRQRETQERLAKLAGVLPALHRAATERR